MHIIRTLSELTKHRSQQKETLALVPTMGALHQGHLSLIQTASKNNTQNTPTQTWVSIFVNPLQFNSSTDLHSYPTPLELDLELCEKHHVHTVFIPTVKEFYPPNFSFNIQETKLSRQLCGAERKEHFDGVCTVVLRLFNLIKPHIALFGKKDYQQLSIIRQLVGDLALNIEIQAGETIREPSGLALSSRNKHLSESQLKDAPRLYRALRAASSIIHTGEQNPQTYIRAAKHHLLNSPAPPPCFTLHYLQLVARDTLQPLANLERPALLALAASYGNTRLIDNIELSPPQFHP